MTQVALILRSALAVVFVVAGAAKLSDLRGTRDTLEAFGLRGDSARYGAWLLPLGELATAVAMLPDPTARWGAVAATVLLATFTVGVGWALSQGRTPNCNCFGQVSSEQISWRTVARNVALLAVAGFLVWRAPGASLGSWTTSSHAASLVAGLALIALLITAVFALHFRQRALATSHAAGPPTAMGLPVGAPAPTFALPTLDGELVTLESLLARGLPIVLIFASPSCIPCTMLMPEVARWRSALRRDISLVVVESDTAHLGLLRDRMTAVGDLEVLVDAGHGVSESYDARITPTGVAVGTDGRIASPPTAGSASIEALVRSVLRTSSTDSAAEQTVALQDA
jgi:uncharacterized membrane protein YphA (DoxX/SURF4 family)